jgi:hypothetical protein
MHTLAWILLVWGAQMDSPDAHSLGSAVAIYSSEEKCIAAGRDNTTGDASHRVAKYAIGVHYRCDSLPLDPPLSRPYDKSDYRSVPNP